MSDWSQTALVAADLIDDLEDQYAGREIEVGRVMLVVEVTGRVDTDDEWTGVNIRCSDGKRWIQKGLLHAALRAVDDSTEVLDEDEDDT